MKKSHLALKSTSSFKFINQAQTNRSVSKQTHAFSKSPRFFIQNPICQKHSYAGQQMKSRKLGAGIGLGKKSDFTLDLTCSPGSSRYNIKSEMDEKGQLHKGWSMGVGRDKFRIGQYISRQLCRTPSSNKYKVDLRNKKKAPTYSIGARTKMINKTMTIEAQNEIQDLQITTIHKQIKIKDFMPVSFERSAMEQINHIDLQAKMPKHPDLEHIIKYQDYLVSGSIQFLRIEEVQMLDLHLAKESLNSTNYKGKVGLFRALDHIELPLNSASTLEKFIDFLCRIYVLYFRIQKEIQNLNSINFITPYVIDSTVQKNPTRSLSDDRSLIDEFDFKQVMHISFQQNNEDLTFLEVS